ncbi:MAG TPA: glycosyltransferase family 39 protein [Opitutaceae bacterium]|jgi:hypothetical protein|nr:glycosyltransferase family 39 protein [Opitutaceae bacterium]
MEISKKPLSSGKDTVAINRLRLCSCFIVPLVLSVLIAVHFVPRKLHMAEEYLELALRPSNMPSSLLRPPGYAFFIRFINLAGGDLSENRLGPVYIGQGIVLGLATIAWYITACRWMTAWHAWLMAMAFGCNPLVIVLVGSVHYDILHLSLSVLVGLLLVRAFADNTVNTGLAVLAGVACGAMTLVRTMTLVEPAFLALALGLQTRMAKSRAVWLAWAAFSLAMAATIAPRTWENYVQTGQFIPVNVQTMSALWPMLEKPIKPNSVNYPWLDLWFSRGLPLLEKEVGPDALNISYAPAHPLVLEHVFGARVRELVRTQPWVYFENFAHNALFFLTGDSRVLIRSFIYYQDNGIYMLPKTWALSFFVASSMLLNVCGALGLALGLWRRDPTVTILASLFFCLWVVHSMFYLDYRYLYVKFPFMLWFTGYLMGEYFKSRSSVQKHPAWIPAVFALSSCLGTALLIF